jgi:hypothetical protein
MQVRVMVVKKSLVRAHASPLFSIATHPSPSSVRWSVCQRISRK